MPRRSCVLSEDKPEGAMRVETPITHDPLPAILEGETSMLPENDRPRDWTNGKIEAAKAPWNEHNTHHS